MPVKNGRHYIRRAIQSVMEQDYRNWSLIIVDDASVDGTSEAVQEFLSDQRIMYIYKEESIGVSKARNVALGEISRGGTLFFWIVMTAWRKILLKIG